MQPLNLSFVDAETSGVRIRKLRRARRFPQEVLAEKAGIHPVYLAGIECGKRNPSFKNLRRIAEAFGISLATLFT